MLRLQNVLERSTQEQHVIPPAGDGGVVVGGSAGGRRGNWRGYVPYLRLIMCLTQDNIKCLFLTRDMPFGSTSFQVPCKCLELTFGGVLETSVQGLILDLSVLFAMDYPQL